MEYQESEETKKIKKLWFLLTTIPDHRRPRVLVFGDKGYVLSEDGHAHASFSMYLNEEELRHFNFSNDTHSRGKILEIFSKIEFIMNEIITIHFSTQHPEQFKEILDSMSFARKIKMLSKWSYIGKDERKLIESLKGVRNDFAHTWSGSIYYNGHSLDRGDSFDEFKMDLEKFWSCLLIAYKKVQPDLDKVINAVEEIRKELKINTPVSERGIGSPLPPTQ